MRFLESNSEHIQSYFIIGFLKYKKSNNYPEAYDYLNTFITKSNHDTKYFWLTIKAKNLIIELKKKMDL